MGNRITRRGRRPQGLGEIVDSLSLSNNIILSPGMNNGSSSEEASSDVPVPLENDPDLTAILSFLLRSGQVRLVRSGGLGPFEVSVNTSGETFDGSDDEDTWRGYRRVRTPPSPRGDIEPDTSVINESEIKGIIERDSGRCNKPENITQKLLQRETPGTRVRCAFSQADKAVCNVNYLPNTFQTVARYRSKAFCGTYSLDGDVFMSACQDQHIRLYDTSGDQFKLFRDITAKDVAWSIIDTAFSPDQHYIIYSSWSEFIHLCNVYGDHEIHLALDLRPSESSFCALSVSFSQDSKEIIAGCNDQCLYIYDRESDERILRIYAHDDDVNAVKFIDETSKRLISGGDDGICKVWDRRLLSENNPKPVGMFAGHTDGITHVCPKGDGYFFISNSKDQSIKLWDMRKFSSQETVKEARHIVANQHWDYRWETVPRRSHRLQAIPGDVSLMTYRGHSVLHTLLRAKFSPYFSTGQQFIYTGCATGSIVVYDVLTGKIHTKMKGAHRKCVRDVSWHPFENTIMSSSWDCTIGKWDYCRQKTEGYYDDIDCRETKFLQQLST